MNQTHYNLKAIQMHTWILDNGCRGASLCPISCEFFKTNFAIFYTTRRNICVFHDYADHLTIDESTLYFAQTLYTLTKRVARDNFF